MVRFRFIVIVLCLASHGFAAETFVDLFNGRDLFGWDGDERIWSVEDGLLTGQTKSNQDIQRNTFAVWTGGEVGDFELRVVFRMDGDNNSGVQYRAQRIPEREHGIAGYQADIHPAANYTGMLYDEGGRGILAERGQKVILNADGSKDAKPLPGERKAVDLSRWNELTITAKGNRLIHKLNGEVTVDVTDNDPKHAERKGLVALQVHAGAPMKVQFKSVRLRRTTEEAEGGDGIGIKTRKGAAATPGEKIKAPDGFEVELLYSVPKEEQGSWVNLCADPKGRLIVSDQHGGLYRITIPTSGAVSERDIERTAVEVGSAHGLLCAFDSLYVVVNRPGKDNERENGLCRVRDTDGDDEYDVIELLRALNGDGEHGPHAVLMGPDQKSLYVVCGNNTRPTEVVHSRVPPIWDEDQLLPRVHGVGFMRGTPAPAGCIYRVDPEGKHWERVASGFRNPFDAAVNADGELFTFDADMEWDFGTPWYRPTRVCHVTSGVDWGWRNGSAKWPVHYADTLPPVVDVGPGSPTGITFGYGAKFPARYQNLLYLCDWTYGKMYALALERRGATYGGALEEFISATPLPLTDVIIHPADGAMYFLIGGRKVQSGLYRVRYVGDESTKPASAKRPLAKERTERRMLEALHVAEHAEVVKMAWPYLSHPDRLVRYAARTAIEHQPLERWQSRALEEQDSQASLTALLALVRKIPRSYRPTGPDLDTPPPSFPAVNADRHPLQPAVLAALGRLNWAELTKEQQLELLRVYQLALYRLGPPDEHWREELMARLDGVYPAHEQDADAMLTEILCYLQAPSAARKGMQLLGEARTQESQLALVHSLRLLRAGWARELRGELLNWFVRARGYKGGVNFQKFIDEMRDDFVARMPEVDREALAELIDASASHEAGGLAAEPRPFVREWTMAEVLPLVETKLRGRDFERGRAMFAAANCFGCHRFGNEGGAMGPDLTSLAGRFSARDILESVLEPSKVISDQYAAVVAITTDGRMVTGRVVNYEGDEVHINTDMLDPTATEEIKRDEIEELETASVSMMPAGLLNTLHEGELLDLMAFLLSRGDRQHEMFAK